MPRSIEAINVAESIVFNFKFNLSLSFSFQRELVKALSKFKVSGRIFYTKQKYSVHRIFLG